MSSDKENPLHSGYLSKSKSQKTEKQCAKKSTTMPTVSAAGSTQTIQASRILTVRRYTDNDTRYRASSSPLDNLSEDENQSTIRLNIGLPVFDPTARELERLKRVEEKKKQRKQARSQPRFGIGKGGMRQLAVRMGHSINSGASSVTSVDSSASSGMRSIRRINREVEHPIALKPIGRLIRYYVKKTESNEGKLRLQGAAIEALREASEHFLAHFFEHCALYVAHGGRVTLMARDLALAKRVGGITGTEVNKSFS